MGKKNSGWDEDRFDSFEVPAPEPRVAEHVLEPNERLENEYDTAMNLDDECEICGEYFLNIIRHVKNSHPNQFYDYFFTTEPMRKEK